ncbi:MAG: hypothetical protein LBR55_05495 [Bacteroidales bacterium]|nr:hypothetical protein [Bacteroidales bacterium]
MVIILCGIALCAYSCKPNCDTTIEKPDDLKPIDWEVYNDVYTVWWNYRSNDGIAHEDLIQKKTIKISGKFDSYFFYSNDVIVVQLVDEHERDFPDNVWGFSKYFAYTIDVWVFLDNSIDKEELLKKLDAWTSLTKRCYVKGSLNVRGGGEHNCPPSIYPGIILDNFNDIYFE